MDAQLGRPLVARERVGRTVLTAGLLGPQQQDVATPLAYLDDSEPLELCDEGLATEAALACRCHALCGELCFEEVLAAVAVVDRPR